MYYRPKKIVIKKLFSLDYSLKELFRLSLSLLIELTAQI